MPFFPRLKRILGLCKDTKLPTARHFKPKPFRPTADDEACTKLWKVYVDQATMYDEGLLKEWKADMEVLLIFSALYSASLTAFIIESYKTLLDDPAQITVDLLSRISQQLNGSTRFESQVPFKPPASSLACNTLLFLSLALALACSLFATFVQQWTRDSIHKTTLKRTHIRKARIIAFLHFGQKDFGMHNFVDLIPILLHTSLFLFFGGLICFLLPVNRPLSFLMMAVLTLLLSVYLAFTVLPLWYLDSPYHTPLSRVLWHLRDASSDVSTLTDAILEQSVQNTAERIERDKKALVYTIKSLTDDNELRPFIEAIPDALYDPKGKVRHPNASLFVPLLFSADPEVNILLRVGQFVSKASYWPTDARIQYSLQCSQALWTLAWISLDSPASQLLYDGNFEHFKQFDRNVLSFLTAVGPSPSGNDIWSALVAICARRIDWICNIGFISIDGAKRSKHSFERASAVLEHLLNGISSHVDKLMPLPDTSSIRHILLKMFKNQPVSAIERILSLKKGGIWQLIRIHMFYTYLTRMRFLKLSESSGHSSTFSPYYRFEEICDMICPRSEDPLDISDIGHQDLHKLLKINDLLPALKNHLNKAACPGDDTDALLRQHLKLFSSTRQPFCSLKESREHRKFILRYLHRPHMNYPLYHAKHWERFELSDLQRIGRCVLEHLKESPVDDAEQSRICLKVVTRLLCTTWRWRAWIEIFPELFSVLHNNSLNLSIKRVEGYPFFKTLLDLVVCIRLVPLRSYYEPLPGESREMSRAKLAQDYLLPHFLSLDALDTKAYRDTLTVAIVSRYIELSCESKLHKFHCRGAMTRPTLYNWASASVDEKIQVFFAKNIAKLVEIIMKGESEPGVLSAILYDSLDFFYSSWGWISSRQSARILWDALSQYQEPGNIQIPAEYEELLKDQGARKREELLEHCWKLFVKSGGRKLR